MAESPAPPIPIRCTRSSASSPPLLGGDASSASCNCFCHLSLRIAASFAAAAPLFNRGASNLHPRTRISSSIATGITHGVGDGMIFWGK